MHTMHRLGLLLLPMALGTLPHSGALAQAEGAAPWQVYIGTYTRGSSEGIYLLQLDPASGRLEMGGLAAETENPAFLALHPSQPVLYAVGEMTEGGSVSAYRILPDTGLLALINRESSGGAGPCHVAVAPSGQHVALANYFGGSTGLLPIAADGRLSPLSDFVQHEGNSVNPSRQEAPHAHSVNFDAGGRFLFVADLGTDQVVVYRYDAEAGKIPPNTPPHVDLAPGAGPRHFVFHPSGRWAYSVNELDSTVTAFAYDAAAGRLDTLGSVATLPADFDGESTTAEIRVHPSGRFLYASNRGHDSIAIFEINLDTGLPAPRGHTLTGGRTPRNFNLDPEGRWLLAANQNSDTVVVFRVNPETGALEETGHQVDVPSPVCVLFARRAG